MHTGHHTPDDPESLPATASWDIEQLIRRRRNSKTHIGCGVAAAALNAAALYLWSTIRANVTPNPGVPLSVGYAVNLAFAIVVGIAAVASTATCLIVWTANTRAAESDLIREIYQQRNTQTIHTQVFAALEAHQKAERQRRWDQWLDDRDTQQAGADRIIPFERGRGGIRNGS